MSYINDLIGVMRGLRMIAEAGVKVQAENTKLIWNNSSIKPILQSCPTNISAPKPNIDLIKEIVERSSVVIQGMTKYSNINTNINSNPEGQVMDPKTKDEIEELNREFLKTFELLQEGNVTPRQNFEAPIDDLVKENANVEQSLAEPALPPARDQPFPLDTEAPVNAGDPQIVNIATVPKPVAKKKLKQSLGANSKARVVPSSRIGRMFSFGTLAAGLGVGTVAQYTRNTLQNITGRTEEHESHAFMSPANAERIVDTLCKVRGAALKLGQLLSIQDETVISPELQRIFERVRQSADFMPAWQVEKVLVAQLGADWKTRVQYFEEKPFAAASIGQVHLVRLLNGQEVAMKVQYPGVAKGINSDIDNLVGVMKVWNIFPKGMFIDNIVEVAKKELAWEVDYVREAYCTKKFKQLLKPYPEYYVPDVVDELCASEVITTELIDGTPLDKLFDAPYETRHDIAYKIMRLCLREMFVLRCMQTDPNWANFFYNTNTEQVILLDFGATREYSKEFMDSYIEIIKAASEGDRDTVLRMSKEMKFLTGYESRVMEETHVDTVMIMGEVFTLDGEFDFGAQTSTRRIQALVPTILNHRLCPPPEEIYSLHRKLSGVFLLCSKMKIKMNCRVIFQDIYEQYKTNSFR
ncbi:hypothetical protein O0L34_g2223 [Tuta absoluta]|nr:hypothetical protein O0L34_g2223 [Tuta absoluta]